MGWKTGRLRDIGLEPTDIGEYWLKISPYFSKITIFHFLNLREQVLTCIL